MIPEKYIRLINGEIDRVNSPRQSAMLKHYLDQNPEARRFYNDLMELGNKLSHTAEAEPPAGLRERIINSMPARPVRRITPSRKISDVLNAIVPRRWTVAYGFLAGAVAGAIVIAAVIGLSYPGVIPEIGHVSGTMLNEGMPAGYVQMDQLTIRCPDADGVILMGKSDSAVALEIHMESRSVVLAKFLYNGREIEFSGVTAPDHRIENLTARNDSLSFISDGNAAIVISFRRISSIRSPVTVSLLKSGAEIVHGVLQPTENK
jgi:hypothetical protein